MNELASIINSYDIAREDNVNMALATVVKIYGSSYRRPGARMLIRDDGKWQGAISGGCLEGDALRKARKVMMDGKAIVVTYDTMDDADAEQMGIGLGCNGIIDVLIEPLITKKETPIISAFRAITKIDAQAVIATLFESNSHSIGSRMVWQEHKEIYNDIAVDHIKAAIDDDIHKALKRQKTFTKHYDFGDDKVRVCYELVMPQIHLMVFGAGYDTIPLLDMASKIGWKTTVTDDCVAHLAPSRFPMVNRLLNASRDSVIDQLTITSRSAAVLMSHSYAYDLAVMKQLVDEDIKYIGILGPRSRAEKLIQEAGLKSSSHIFAPAGLDLGSEEPAEIALSIIAEIKAVFSQKEGGFLKNKKGTIHKREKEESVVISYAHSE